MRPEHKFHSYVTAATVTVMYFVITSFLPRLAPSPSLEPFAKPIGSLLLSVGIYRSLATAMASASRRLKFLKRHLLGPRYVNGTWVGKFHAADDTMVFSIEHFEQTLTTLKIRGQAFRASGELYAYWNSVSESIDDAAGTLTFTYSCDKSSDKASFQGVCFFQFERGDETMAPTAICGYSADLVDGIRTENRETRLSEDLLPFDEALRRALKQGQDTQSPSAGPVKLTAG
jgi:hypothetical protein